jgi:hypothetical protein
VQSPVGTTEEQEAWTERRSDWKMETEAMPTAMEVDAHSGKVAFHLLHGLMRMSYSPSNRPRHGPAVQDLSENNASTVRPSSSSVRFRARSSGAAGHSWERVGGRGTLASGEVWRPPGLAWLVDPPMIWGKEGIKFGDPRGTLRKRRKQAEINAEKQKQKQNQIRRINKHVTNLQDAHR